MLKIDFKQLNKKHVVKLLLPIGSVARFLNNSTFKVTLITLQVSTTIILLIAILHLSRFVEQAEQISILSSSKLGQTYSQANFLSNQEIQINSNSTLEHLSEKNSQNGRIFQLINLVVPAVILLQVCACTQTVLKKKQANSQALILLLIALLDLFLFYQSLGSSFFRSLEVYNVLENQKEKLERNRVIYSIMIMGKLISMLITLSSHNKQEVITDQSCSDINLNSEQQKKESSRGTTKKQQVLSNKLNFIPASVPNQDKKLTIQKLKNKITQQPLKQLKRESLAHTQTQNESVKSSPSKNIQSSIKRSSSIQNTPTFQKSENDSVLPFAPQPETEISQQQPEFNHLHQQPFQKAEEDLQLNSSLQLQKSSISAELIPINPDNQANHSQNPTQNSPSMLVFPQLTDQPISPKQRPTIPINLSCQKLSSTTDKEIVLETPGEDIKAKWSLNQIQKRNKKVQSSSTQNLNNSSNNANNLDLSLSGTRSSAHTLTPSHQVAQDEQDSTNDESNFQSTNSNQELLVSHTPDISHLALAGDGCRKKREYLDEAQIIKTAYFEMFFQQGFQQSQMCNTKTEANKYFCKNESSESEDEDGDCENDDDDEEDEDDIKQSIIKKLDKNKFFQNSRTIHGHLSNNEDICSDTTSTQYQELFSVADEIKSHLDLDLGDDNSLFSNSLRMKAIDDELSLLESEDALKKKSKKKKSTEQKKKRRNKRKQMQKEKKQLLKETGGDLKSGSKDTPNPKKSGQSQGNQVSHSLFSNESRNVQMKRLLDENLLEYFTLNVIISQGLSVSVFITDFSQFDYQFDMQSQFYGVDKDTILDSKINFIFEFLSLNLYPTLTPFFEGLLSQYASIKLQQAFETEELFKLSALNDPNHENIDNNIFSVNNEQLTSSFI